MACLFVDKCCRLGCDTMQPEKNPPNYTADNGGSKLHQDNGKFLPDHKVLHHKRPILHCHCNKKVLLMFNSRKKSFSKITITGK